MAGFDQKGLMGKIFSLQTLLILVFLIFLIIQYKDVRSSKAILDSLTGNSSSKIVEIGEMKDLMLQMGSDMNEMRNFLRMPLKDYGFDEVKSEEADESKNDNEVQVAMYEYFNSLAAQEKLNKTVKTKKSLLEAFVANEELKKAATELELIAPILKEDDKSITVSVDTLDGKNIVFYHLNKDDGALNRRSVNEKIEITNEVPTEFVNENIFYLKNRKAEALAAMVAIEERKQSIVKSLEDEKVAALVAAKNISINIQPTEADLKLTFEIKNKGSEPIGQVILDQVALKIEFVDLKSPEKSLKSADPATQMLGFLEGLKSGTFIEEKVTANKKTIEETISSEAFKTAVSQAGFKMSEAAREDADRYYYDILNSDGEKIKSLVLEKATAVVNVVNPDGTNSQNILFIEEGLKKKL